MCPWCTVLGSITPWNPKFPHLHPSSWSLLGGGGGFLSEKQSQLWFLHLQSDCCFDLGSVIASVNKRFQHTLGLWLKLMSTLPWEENTSYKGKIIKHYIKVWFQINGSHTLAPLTAQRNIYLLKKKNQVFYYCELVLTGEGGRRRAGLGWPWSVTGLMFGGLLSRFALVSHSQDRDSNELLQKRRGQYRKKCPRF